MAAKLGHMARSEALRGLSTFATALAVLLLLSGRLAEASFESREPLGGDEFESLATQVPELERGRERGAVQTGIDAVDKVERFELEHSLGGRHGEFTPAGDFSVRVRTSMQGVQKLSRLQLERATLSAGERAAFEELVVADGYYRVRVPASVFGSGKFVVASAKARCVALAQQTDHFELHVESAGNIVAITYLPQADCSRASTTDIRFESIWKFNSSAALKYGQQAPKLIPASEQLFLAAEAAAERRKPGEEPEKPAEPKTFWQKYWFYIVPGGMLLLNIVLSGAAAEGQGGPPGGAQRPAGGGAPRRR